MIAAVSVAALASCGPAVAAGCGAASSQVDLAICAEPALAEAEGRLSAVFARLMEASADPLLLGAFAASQARWSAARALQSWDEDVPDAEASSILLAEAETRIDDLDRFASGAVLAGARLALDRAGGAGGAYAGYAGSCSFLPMTHETPGLYSCTGSVTVQDGPRVCRAGERRSGGALRGFGVAAGVVAGRAQVEAQCGGASPCPDWKRALGGRVVDAAGEGPLAAYDPDLAASRPAWMEACLRGPALPRSDELSVGFAPVPGGAPPP